MTALSSQVGGRELDECLMRTFAGQFKKKHGCDPLSSKKAAFKLEDAVMKTKKALAPRRNLQLRCARLAVVCISRAVAHEAVDRPRGQKAKATTRVAWTPDPPVA